MSELSLLKVGTTERMGLGWEGSRCLARWAPAEPVKNAKVRGVRVASNLVPVVDGDTSPRAFVRDRQIEPGEGEIHLWEAPLEVPQEALTTMAETLDGGERTRAERYRFETHRRQYIAAHGALRRILSQYAGLPPASIRYRYDAFGRPQLAPEMDPSGLDFSLSHSGELAIVAVAGSGRVGADVEELRDLAWEYGLAGQILSADEWSEWRRCPVQARTEALLRLWTRKEACLKADGLALRKDPRQVPVGLDFNLGSCWSCVRPFGHGGPRWAVCTLKLNPGYLASVAVAE